MCIRDRYKDLGGVYIYMLEGMKNKFKDLFDIFLKYPYDGVMFHCSAGKDRTGITAALLLDLMGCHEYDIVKDYSESYENNIEINEELAKMMAVSYTHLDVYKRQLDMRMSICRC